MAAKSPRRHSLATRLSVAIGLLSVSMAILTSILFYEESNERLISVARENLDGQLAIQNAELEAAVQEMVRDVRLMASTPPVQGLIRAQKNGGIDPLDGSTEAQWRERLSTLFRGMLESKPAYLQVRYISGSDNGRELVRVHRASAAGPIQRVAEDALQEKGGEPYVGQTLGLGADEVFISEPNLNREHGRIQKPLVTVIRAAVPIYDGDEGSVFGLVIINLDARPVLERLRGHADAQLRYTTDGAGQYLLHPLKEAAFAHELGEMPNADEDFPGLRTVLEGRDDGRARVDADMIVAMRRVQLGSGEHAPTLGLIIVQPVSSVIHGNMDALVGLVPVLLLLSVFGLLLGIVLARIAVRPIASLAAAVRGLDVEHRTVRRPPGLIGEAADLADSLERAIESLRAADRVEANNRELRQFAYVASHDLREPLRTISSCADMLDEEYRDQFDDEGRAMLGFIKRAASRMGALLTALLEHSQLGATASPSLCDLDQVLVDVREDLNQRIQDTDAVIEVEPLGSMVVYATPVRLLFQNLVSNAIKFYNGDETPRVHISAEPTRDGMRFRVCDNGPGIPENKREQVFMMFKRLHKRSEVEGTGIGLANSRKVVEMHGGEIAVGDSPLGGACFEFELKRVS